MSGPFKAYAGARQRRIGIHRKTAGIYWWGSAYGLQLRARGLLRGVFAHDERDDVKAWANRKGYAIKLVDVLVTSHIIGKEYRVHWRLLAAVEKFMRQNAPNRLVDIISGFRSYASQLRLWLAFLAGTGNPANKPGSSKHEATGGYSVARAIDAYIGGVPFWAWVNARGLRDEAAALGLRQPYDHEPWHVELAGL